MIKKWMAQNSMWMDRYELVCFHYEGNTRIVRRFSERVDAVPEGHMITEPTLSVSGDEAQQIMNALWDTGLRPNNGAGAVAHTEAIEAHLQDMRTIAFNRLKISDGRRQNDI